MSRYRGNPYSELLDMMATAMGGGGIECPVCFERFSDQNDFIEHTAIHDTHNRITCPLCYQNDGETVYTDSLLQHVVGNHIFEISTNVKEKEIRASSIIDRNPHSKQTIGIPNTSHSSKVLPRNKNENGILEDDISALGRRGSPQRSSFVKNLLLQLILEKQTR